MYFFDNLHTQSAVEILLGHILALTESTKISADAPVKVSNPAFLKSVNASTVDIPDNLQHEESYRR